MSNPIKPTKYGTCDLYIPPEESRFAGVKHVVSDKAHLAVESTQGAVSKLWQGAMKLAGRARVAVTEQPDQQPLVASQTVTNYH